MTETPNLSLPLLQPAQAQKHVTVNEALIRLDGATNLTLASVTASIPPAAAPEGTAFGVPIGAVNAWEGKGGRIALFSNGGWVFIAPRRGWRAWIDDQSSEATFDGVDWVAGVLGLTESGASTRLTVTEFDHQVAPGATSDTTFEIPQYAMVFGVTGRVIDALSGSLADWSLGTAESATRYGNGLSTGQGSWVMGLSGTPVAYYAPTRIRLTANGGAFAGGTVRFAVHHMVLGLPGF